MSDSRSRLPLVVAGAAAAAAAAAFVIYTRRCQAPATSAADSPPVAAHAPSQASSSGTPALPPTKDSASGAPPIAPTVSKEQQEEAQRAKERGNKRFQGKQYQLAITEYTNAIGLLKDANDPAVAIFYGNRTQCNACLDQHEAAEADCTAALCIDPKYVKALVRRATAREKLGKAEQAMVDYTGALLLSDMQHEMASTGVDRLVKEVAAAKTKKRLEEPMRCLPSPYFIATFVDSFQAHRERLSKTRPTVDKLTEALAPNPSKPVRPALRAQLLTNRALANMQARAYESAMLDWAEAVSLISPLGDDGAPSGQTAPSSAERESTLKEWTTAKDVPASPALALGMLGMFFHLRGSYDQAMACYDRSLELHNSVEVLLKRSSLWFEKEQLAKAFADFDLAIALQPKQPDIYCHRGQLHMLQQDLNKAVDDLKKSVKLDGNSVLARIQLGMAHHRLKQTTDARSVFQETETRFPQSPDALNYHGEFLVESGDLPGARAKFNKAIEVSGGGFALAHVNLGVLKLHADQDVEGAIEKCKEAIVADPLCETAHVHMAHLMLQKNDLAVAVAAFDDAVALLRVKQELEETFAMREAAAAQLTLVTEQPDVYLPALEKQRAQAKAMMAAGMPPM